jgi:hypothetical protein
MVPGFFDTVGDEHDRRAEGLPDFQQFILQVAPGERIQRAERLVHQHDRRFQGQHAGDGNTLAHASRQILRKARAEILQLEHIQQEVDPFLDGRRRAAGHFQAKGNVALDRHPGEQGVLLEHHAAIGPRFGDALVPYQDLARGGMRKPGNRIQQGRLAAARRAEQADELAAVDVQVDVLERNDLASMAGKYLVDSVDMDGCHAVSFNDGRDRDATSASGCSVRSCRCR